MVKILNYASPEMEEKYKELDDETRPVVEDEPVVKQKRGRNRPRLLRKADDPPVATIPQTKISTTLSAQSTVPSGPVVPTGVTEEDIKFEEEQAEQRRLEKIDTEIDYEAADAETDMPTPSDMAKQQMINLGLAIPEKIVDTTSRT